MQPELSSNRKDIVSGSVRPDEAARQDGFVRAAASPRPVTYWRVEGSLLEISTLRTVGFFNWNSQSFLERWLRAGLYSNLKPHGVYKDAGWKPALRRMDRAPRPN